MEKYKSNGGISLKQWKVCLKKKKAPCHEAMVWNNSSNQFLQNFAGFFLGVLLPKMSDIIAALFKKQSCVECSNVFMLGVTLQEQLINL